MHLSSAQNAQEPSMSSAPLNKPWGALLLNPGDRPEARWNFTSVPAVTCQATRWRSGVRKVRDDAAAGLRGDVGMASDYSQRRKEEEILLHRGFCVPGPVWVLYRDDTMLSSSQSWKQV